MASGPPDKLEWALGRLQVLEDERGILQTLYGYGHCYDYNDHEGWVDCFIDDASYDVITGDGRTIIACRGRRELDEHIRGHNHAIGRWTQHLLVEPIIHINGDDASSVAYFVRVDDRGATPYISTTGRYHDELRRCEDGTWRFVSRTANMEAQALSR
jgi:hypothetical protein